MKTLVFVFTGMTSAFLAVRLIEHKGKNSSKNCEKYSRSTLGLARYLRSYWDRRADAGCCVLLRAPAQKRQRKSEGPTPRCTNITTIVFFFSQKRKTAMCKPSNEAGLLYEWMALLQLSVHTLLVVSGALGLEILILFISAWTKMYSWKEDNC
jgi:hypothetical protein